MTRCLATAVNSTKTDNHEKLHDIDHSPFFSQTLSNLTDYSNRDSLE